MENATRDSELSFALTKQENKNSLKHIIFPYSLQ